MDFVEPKYVSLKDHPTYNERWLHEKIRKNPSLLGLEDLQVRDSERSQPNGGRLDLLQFNPETDTRYEVELQLGATDESHLIRTIEYWDIERKRYPQYEHIAVIVAEHVTRRFLNVIGFFNQANPLIAIQLRAVEVRDTLTPIATQVLGLIEHGTDKEDEGQTADRSYWKQRASEEAIHVCDEIVTMIQEVKPDIEAMYNRNSIGLTGSAGTQNFVILHPRKGEYAGVRFRIPFDEDLDRDIDESSLEKLPYKHNRFRVRIRKPDFDDSRAVIERLICQAHEHYIAGE